MDPAGLNIAEITMKCWHWVPLMTLSRLLSGKALAVGALSRSKTAGIALAHGLSLKTQFVSSLVGPSIGSSLIYISNVSTVEGVKAVGLSTDVILLGCMDCTLFPTAQAPQHLPSANPP